MFLVLFVSVHADAVLLALVPVTIVLTAIRPVEHALALFHVLKVLAIVDAVIRQPELPFTVHFIVEPITFVYSAIRPDVLSIPLHLIILKMAEIPRLIWPHQLAVSFFFAIFELAFVNCPILFNMLALAMHAISNPIPLESVTVGVFVNSLVMCLIVLPVSFIHISFHIN